MAMANVFVITADADYECNTPILAYATKAQADAFKRACELHSYDKPEWPRGTGDEEKDARNYEKYSRARSRWEKKHPAGKDWADYDTKFTIHELAVVAPTLAGKAEGE